MLPNAFIPVDTIPLTATGKLDRRRSREVGSKLTQDYLAALSLEGSLQRRPPSTTMERHLQSLWAAVLKVEMVSSVQTIASFPSVIIQSLRYD